MDTCFIIHGSFGNSHEHWIPWLKAELEKQNYEAITPDFPIGKDIQTYNSWKKVLDRFKDKINSNTIFIGRSIAPIFIVKYVTQNHLKIKALYSVSGFNGRINIPDYDYVNKTFFLNEIKGFEKFCHQRVCFLSKNDPYVPYKLLDEFSKNIKAKRYLIENGGHFNTDAGYNQFQELLSIINQQTDSHKN